MERRFCPRCKSENVNINISASSALGVPQNWICNDCGYSNIIFPLKETLNKKQKKKNDRRKR